MERDETKPSTADEAYAARLVAYESIWWKRLLDVQAPYRWNLRRLQPGFTLDIGCGLGRNLLHLDGNGVGVDHNPQSVEIARARGLNAFTVDKFRASQFNAESTFDSLLLAHVVEHMTEPEAVALVGEYLDLLRPSGQVILITPQEAGYRSDPTHVQFIDFEAGRRIARGCGLEPVREFSFPFPRIFGRLFKYNEFIVVSRKAQRRAAMAV